MNRNYIKEVMYCPVGVILFPLAVTNQELKVCVESVPAIVTLIAD